MAVWSRLIDVLKEALEALAGAGGGGRQRESDAIAVEGERRRDPLSPRPSGRQGRGSRERFGQ